MRILLLKYNNYFNRAVKKEDSLSGYAAASERHAYFDGINFKPADSVSTTQIANIDSDWTPDYLVTEDMTRWFVLECRTIRQGQVELTLRRDVLADFEDAYMDAPALIERGPLRADSPFIYNKERFSFNQIKRSETLLKDETGTAWIVGYVSTDTDYDGYIESPAESGGEPIPTFDDLGLILNDETDPLLGATAKAIAKCEVRARIADGPSNTVASVVGASWDGSSTWLGGQSFPSYVNFRFNGSFQEAKEKKTAYAASLADVMALRRYQVEDGLEDWAGISVDQIGLERIKAMVGQQIYDPTAAKVYTVISVSQSKDDGGATQLKQGDSAKLYSELAYDLKTANQGIGYEYLDGNPIEIELDSYALSVSLAESDYEGQRRVKMSNLRRRLLDAPYDMFCMPFDLKNLALAQAFVTTAAEGKTKKIYDLQILPYCPNRQYAETGGAGLRENVDYDVIEEYDGTSWKFASYLFWNSRSSGTLFNHTRLTGSRLDDKNLSPAEKRKAMNECMSWRLTSPNYNGSWEFNVAKNGGSVDGFRIDYTYRPYSPYIHVAPIFKGLYGDVNDDARGLICNGDFSIDIASDAWAEYQISNKNYQNIFNTQIKTMDANHALDMASNAVSSVLGAAGSGLGIGALTGSGAFGAAAGIASGIGGIADLAFAEAKYRNSRQQAIDLHEYQLGNVKAQPDTLTKVSSYNVNNKYFPFVEEYSCTDGETDAFVAYLRERGCSIGVVSTVREALSQGEGGDYVKASVMRMPAIADDFHLASAIAEELETGAYM